jgi:hypothetical protein
MNQMIQGGIPIGTSLVKSSPPSKMKPKLTKSDLLTQQQHQGEDSTIGFHQKGSPRSFNDYESEREYLEDVYPESYSKGYEDT